MMRRTVPMLLLALLVLVACAPLARTAAPLDSDASIDELSAALAKAPHDPLLLYQRASALERAGRTDEALADVNLALEHEPRTADAYLLRGALLLARESRDAALADFDAGMALIPSDPYVLAYQAIAYAREGNTAAAGVDLARAEQLGLPAAQAQRVRQVIAALAE